MEVNPTAWALWRRGALRCPRCKRSRMWPIFYLYAYQCRWGHVTPAFEVAPWR